MFDVRLWSAAGIRFGQLRFTIRRASREDEKQRKQWEMEHQAALDAMAADGLLDDRNSFAMVSPFHAKKISWHFGLHSRS